MNQEDFKKQIEHPLNLWVEIEDKRFWTGMHIKATIGRTIRLCLKYPDLAQEYLDSLPKATMD